MRKVYSNFWITAREEYYGFTDYDKKLCNLIEKCIPSGMILDVGVGTGYPIGGYFLSAGYDVYGIDIAEDLIKKCNEDYPDIKAFVGDAENIKFPKNHFDAVYCFHSSWYFSDLYKVINEMIRVTKKGGYVIFDIMNANARETKITHIKAKTIDRFMKIASSLIRSIQGDKKGNILWALHFEQTPTSPVHLNAYLTENNIDYMFGPFNDFVFTKDSKISITQNKIVYIIHK